MQDNEISLKELILILINGWKWIIGLTLVSLIISIALVFGFNTSTYQLNLSGTLIKTDVYDTSFGSYPAHTIKNLDLIDLVKSEEFSDYTATDAKPFTINTSLSDVGVFTITLSASESTDLSVVRNRIQENLEPYVNFYLQGRAIEYFTDFNQITIERSNTTIESNLKLLETISQKLSSIDRLLAPDIINPEYNVFSSQRANVEYETMRLQSELEKTSKNQDLLKEYVVKDYKEYLSRKDHIGVIEASLQFNSPSGIQELRKFNPMTLIPISVILGGMLGVFIVFFLHYWKNN